VWGRKGEKKMKKDKSHVIERGGKEVVFCHPFYRLDFTVAAKIDLLPASQALGD
jgi:hypothetical protein